MTNPTNRPDWYNSPHPDATRGEFNLGCLSALILTIIIFVIWKIIHG